MKKPPEHLVIITGLSGSGKSYVQSTMEDLGFYCVDNLPIALIEPFLEDVTTRGGQTHVGIVADVRTHDFATIFPSLFAGRIRELVPNAALIFLEATDEVLARRFSETRRPHPFGHDRPLPDAIRAERSALEDVKALANMVLDTSQFSVHELKGQIIRRFELQNAPSSLLVTIITFGFKYAAPYNLDLLFDVRFLPNPHFIDALRPKTGKDPEIVAYLEAQPEYRNFVTRLSDFVGYLVPQYEKEMKSYLTIGVGCTGGRHRSVAIGERLARELGESGYSVEIVHRDCSR
ncbi:MAG TPA: RNase adapter RapZ [Thermoanaerobaculia bacterium]|nr:RNase adapter RapZ [Thermoanaerobaculia bacterium]